MQFRSDAHRRRRRSKDTRSFSLGRVSVDELEPRLCLATIAFMGPHLTYNAADDVANHVSLSVDGAGVYTIDDANDPTSAVLNAPPSCVVQGVGPGGPAGPVTIDCDDADLESLTFNLGNLDDTVQVFSARDALTVNDDAGSDEVVIAGPMNLPGKLEATAESIGVSADVVTSGGIQLTVVDTPAAGDDLVVPSGVTLRTSGGAISLAAGDDIHLQPGSWLVAYHVKLRTDFGDSDPGVGSQAIISGAIQGRTASLSGGADDDQFVIDDNGPNSVGGTVNNLMSILTVNGAGGANGLTLDDSSETRRTTVTVRANQVGVGPYDNLFGSGGRIRSYMNISSLDLGTGDGGNVVLIKSTHAGATTIRGGAGADIFKGEDNRLDDLQGIVTIMGQEGIDILRLNDRGAPEPTVYEITNSSVTVSSASVQSQISHDDVEVIELFTGNENDQVTIHVADVGFPAIVDVDTGGGDDQIAINLADTPNATEINLDGGAGRNSLEITAGSLSDQINFGSVITVGDTTITPTNLDDFAVQGGDGPDIIDTTAFTAPVMISGGGGSDEIRTGSGNDVVSGGSGDDTIDTGDGDDVIDAGDGDDIIFAGSGSNTVDAGDGDDSIKAGDGDDLIFGGAGNDNINGGGANDIINAGNGNDIIFGGGGNDAINGGDGNDVINSGDGNDIIFGGAGNDTVNGGDGNDVINSGDGNDIIFGGAGNDTVNGGSGNDVINSGDGNDIIFGDTGNDMINAGDGNDIIFGGTGDDDINGGSGNDVINSGDGNDIIFGGGGDDSVNGGAGNDVIDSSDGNDIIFGGAGDDQVVAGDGHDLIFADSGDDSLDGGGGDDVYVFGGTGLGNDTLIEAADVDTDTLDFSNFGGEVVVDLGNFGPQVVNAGNLTLAFGHFDGPPPVAGEFRGIENAVGGPFADVITGNSRNNRLLGADQFRFPPTPMPTEASQTETQIVFLDFDTETDVAVGDHLYTAGERAAIQARMEADFAGFNYEFTQTQPASGSYATVFFNKFAEQGGVPVAGIADELDFRNLNLGGTVAVNVGIVLGGPGEPDASSANVVAASATLASHELGHLVGFRHADSFGPIGFGVHDPPGDDAFLPAYPGHVGAFETTGHLMATPASVGSLLMDAVGDPFFGERTLIRSAFNEYGAVVAESAGDHATVETAQHLEPVGLPVPNTMPQGLDAAKTFAVEAVALVGSIEIGATAVSESDFYSFDGDAGEQVTIEVISEALARFPNPIDSVLRVYNSDGTLLPFFNGVAENDDSFEPTDSLLIDLLLPDDGSYFIEVDTFTFLGQPDIDQFCGPGGTFEGSDSCTDTDTGDYELFFYRFDAGTDDLGDVLSGRGGNDTLIGGIGDDTLDGGAGDDVADGGADNDTVVLVPGSHDIAVDIRGETGGADLLDFSGAAAGVSIDLAMNEGTPQVVDSQLNTVALFGDFENVIGSAFDDLIRGNNNSNALDGRGGNDILVGRDGGDTLTGDAGRDIMIGGRGSDGMHGGDGQDILIGGRTDYDSVDSALEAFRLEWTSERSYGDRVYLLRTGIPPQEGESAELLALNAATITDIVVDELTGAADLDWFLVFASGDLTDRDSDETID